MKIKWNLSRLIGEEPDFPLEHRFLNVIALIGIIMSFSSSIMNYVFRLGTVTVLATFGCGVVSVYLYYLSIVKKKYALPVNLALIIITFVFYPTMWIVNAGTAGSIPYYMVVYSAMIAVLLKGTKRNVFILIYLVAAGGLVLFEYNFPELIRGYDSKMARYLDVAFGYYVSVIVNALLVATIVRGYRQKQERVEHYLKQVEKQRREIELKNRQLEKRNFELKEARERMKRLNKRLHRISITDSLTGIFNRRYMFQILEKEIKKSRIDGKNFGVILLDIDHFKTINDTYGHFFGDMVLKKVSDNIKINLRETDILGRLGGEEFLIVLPDTDIKNALLIAERIRQKIQELKWEKNDLKITVSGGVYEYNHEKMIDLLKEVDDYLYRAKESGRNRIECNIS